MRSKEKRGLGASLRMGLGRHRNQLSSRRIEMKGRVSQMSAKKKKSV